MRNLNRTHFLITMTFCSLSLVSGCQLVKLHENKLSQSLQEKTDNVLTDQKLSSESLQVLSMIQQTEASCLKNFDTCITALKNNPFTSEQIYATASELYLSRALTTDQHSHCKKMLSEEKSKLSQTNVKTCLDQQLSDFDMSLRYSYVYLFKSDQTPESRIFDLRQAQVRTFYNVALSRLITTSFHRFNYHQFPESLMLGSSLYHFKFDHYQDLSKAKVDKIQSSYNLNFSALDRINRQEGIGSEFVLIKQSNLPEKAQSFLLDPEQYFQGKSNPNIHDPRYLAVSAVAAPSIAHKNAEEILSNETAFNIELYNPYLYQTAQLENKNYTLTANYSVPYALWLAENKLGSAGYWTLLNREQNLQMPHLFKLEPYQPNKKIIVMIHGLASSPETWISLTNNIMGDPKLRDHYQVWQVFYSTNMPIFESRFQINALLKQAFAQLQPNTPSAQDAVLIGHSMGGIISRLLVSDADISAQAIPLMNYEQNIQLQHNPIIRERFVFKPVQPFSRAIFISAPHRGTTYADRWFTNIAKKMIVLPLHFLDDVNAHLPNAKNSSQGLVRSGPADLSEKSRFIKLTSGVMPSPTIPYHSIMGNLSKTHDVAQMSDGIVPYTSSHLEGAVSEKVIDGGHSIHETSEAILELRRILRLHLDGK